nr:hypothetical protein [Clostridioides sp.]
MERILIFLLFVNSFIIAITKALSNINKLLDNYIALKKKIDKIKEHPNGNSDAHED